MRWPEVQEDQGCAFWSLVIFALYALIAVGILLAVKLL